MQRVHGDINRFYREVRHNVSRSQIDDSHNWFAVQNGQSAKVSIVSNNDTVFCDCSSKQVDISRPEETFFGQSHIEHIKATLSQQLDDPTMYILVG